MSNEYADIQRALGRIEGAVTAIKDGMERGSKRMDGHDKRLGSLERWRSWSTGIGATVAALLGLSHLPKL